MTTVNTYPETDLNQLIVQSFKQKNGAFLGSLACQLEVRFAEIEDGVPTAGVNSTTLVINKDYFDSIPPESRMTIFTHELWHLALLHEVRIGDRDPYLWNIAGDHIINNMLEEDGYSFNGIENCHKDPKFKGMAEDDVYKILHDDDEQDKDHSGNWDTSGPDSGDMKGSGGSSADTALNNARAIDKVKIAMDQSNKGHKEGYGQGGLTIVEKLLDKYTKPQVDWKMILHRYLRDYTNRTKQNWNKRNRRFNDVILPGRTKMKCLEHMVFAFDTSYSTSDEDVNQFAVELRKIKELYQPNKLTLVQFTHEITSVKEHSKYDDLSDLTIHARGGTDLAPVKELLDNMEPVPTVAIIFSDMECEPMEKLKHDHITDVIWVVVNNEHATVPYGKRLDITVEGNY